MSDVCREWCWGIRLMGLRHTEWMAGLLASVKKLQPGSNIDFEKILNFN